MKPLLKICGMKHNIAEVAELQPDYLWWREAHQA